MARAPAGASDGDPVDPGMSFPDENPNPVMRIGWDGTLIYANRASDPITDRLAVRPGDRVPDAFLQELEPSGEASPKPDFELTCDLQTFSIRSVRVLDREAWNVYGTDITGAKVVEKFPDRNPNPVLRVSPEGTLLYANRASAIITRAVGIALGDVLPDELMARIVGRLDGMHSDPIRVSGEGHIFELKPVLIPEFRFINVYGTDVTAVHAVTAFPDENPNPVLRINQAGRLEYANPASEPVRRALGARVGAPLPVELLERLRDIAAGPAPNTLEIESEGRLFALRVVSLIQFESINMYGTDITAARDVQRLLLNILPAPIVERLQQGETLIADRFEEMAVLFADIVDFTPFSASHQPAEVVGILNQVFSMFDRLADRHGLEKIKTIGDAYMVAGGTTPEGGRVENVAEMALDMVDGIHDYRTDAGARLKIRIGLHIGPAVGGIIGLRKFIYDFWGDTVNTASRLESHGVPGHIQVTAATAARLSRGFAFAPRGAVDLKGKGLVEAFFLTGRRVR